MVLRLSDSRALHMMEAHRAKNEQASHIKSQAIHHSKMLQKNLKEFQSFKSELQKLSDNQEAIRAILTRDLCDPLNELRKRAIDNGAIMNTLSSNLHDLKNTPAATSETALVQRKLESDTRIPKEEGILLELQAIHQDIARLERTMQNNFYAQKVTEVPCLDLEGIRETIQEVLVTTPITTIAPNLEPIIEDCRTHSDNLNRMGMRLGELIQEEVKNLQRTQSASTDALKSGIKSLEETVIQVNGPTRTAVEQMRRELLERGAQHDTSDGDERLPEAVYDDRDPKTNPSKGVRASYGKSEHTQYSRSRISEYRRPNYPLIVESIDPRHTSDTVMATVKEKVSIVELGVGVHSMKKAKNQRVVLNCDSEEDRNVLQEAIKNKDPSLTIKRPITRNPLIRLIGVTKDLSDAMIEEAIIKQNARLFTDIPETDRRVKVQRRTKGRNDLMSNVILEVSPKMWSNLKDNRIRLGYQIVPAADQSPVQQCYKCMGFSHVAKHCTVEAPRCGFCSDSHDTRLCTKANGPPTCYNCTTDKSSRSTCHAAYSALCPVWQKWDRIARSAVSYC
ncbi:hypothetical protein NE865_14061 [Phthorimaea operculella]|nr:hypothetical protein NE865_14061 [Phthorimaea operculella]